MEGSEVFANPRSQYFIKLKERKLEREREMSSDRKRVGEDEEDLRGEHMVVEGRDGC